MRRLRLLRMMAVFLAGGVAATVMLAWASAFLIDLSASAGSTIQNGAAWDGHVQWTVRVNSFLGSARVYSKRERGRAWSVEQATGPPDTGVSGDIQTAWASLTPD